MRLLTFFILFSLSFILMTSCSGNDNEVSIEGRVLHMNMAKFYVYSTDGVTDGVDTIYVQGGRFDFYKEITKGGTLVVVFPNFTQLPVFVQPGDGIDFNGDAQHLKELEVTGNDDNEAFTAWRKANANASIHDQKKSAEKFIKDNPGSLISLWLLRQYYVMTDNTPDIPGALALLKHMQEADPENLAVKKMHSQLSMTEVVFQNEKLGHFSATDINGRNVNEGMLQNGYCVVMTAASWNFESQNMLRRVAGRKRDASFSGGNGTPISSVIVVSLDADIKECRKMVSNCNADNVSVICDGRQFDSPLLKSLHLNTIPDNLVLKDGKIQKERVATDKL